MTKENGVKVLTDMVADFVAHIGKKLPDDVVNKLEELGSQETAALPKVLYETMTKNQGLAVELNHPSCQDTGVLQFWLKCGTNFPYINELEALLKDAVVQATFAAPLRHNSVETFDEYNTKKNVGKGTPTVWWDIVPNSDKCEIYAYMAGGGCTLPGKAMVLMPGAGYEGVTDFVLDQMAQKHLQRLPVLLVHGEQEKRQHHQNHAQRRRGGPQARLCQKEKRHAYQRRRSETDHLSFGQPEQDLALYPAQVLRDRYISHSSP